MFESFQRSAMHVRVSVTERCSLQDAIPEI